MSKAAHTDLPWVYNEIKPHHYNIPTFEISGMNTIYWVAQVRNVDQSPYGEEARKCRANADLIVLAVNNHQELLTRLSTLVNDAKTVLLDLGAHVATDDVNSNGLLLSVTQAEELIKKLTP
jgi:hypothetical protein